jgi:hypothetical protein
MDAAANMDEVRLRKGSSLGERLGWAGAGAALLLILVPGLLAWTSGGHPLIAVLWALPLGLFLIGVAALERNVAWIITRDGILIGEQRPFGQVHKRMIRQHDLAEVRVRRNRFSYPASFSLACRLASGDVLISPPLPVITRVNETAATVAELLGLPDVAPVDNPLDVGKAEITLGSPVSPDFGRVIRMTVPVLAGLCAVPFLVAFWIGESEMALEFLLPLGLLAAFALYRYAHRLAGAFWIIRHGEVRIERITLNGEPSVERIKADDVASVDVVKPNSEDRTYRIAIRLHNGQIFRIPTSHDENGAYAVRAEIIRRLDSPPDAAIPTG